MGLEEATRQSSLGPLSPGSSAVVSLKENHLVQVSVFPVPEPVLGVGLIRIHDIYSEKGV
jgi:hypothetical protein